MKLPIYAISLCAILGLGGCNAPKDADDSASGDDSSADDSAPTTYTIQGMAVAFGADRLPAPEGTCLNLVNPQEGIDGGTPSTLASTTIGAGGAFTLTEVPIFELPPLMIIDDCGNEPPRVFPTGTIIPPDRMETVEPGGTLSDVQAAALTVESLDAITASLTVAGSGADVTQDGMLIAPVWNINDQSPIAGATITCSGCDVYYSDGDASDGGFTTAGVRNTQTAADALVVIPGAPIGSYSAQAPGYSFESIMVGAIPNGALLVAFFGTPQ